MTDLTAGKRFDRVSGTWLDPQEHARRYADWDEAAFQRKASQGELCAPMIISDTQPAMMSMTDGKHYDSKSALRKEYKRAGVEEVGTEKVKGKSWLDKKEKRKKQREGIKASLYRAHSRMGFGAP